MVHVFRSLFDLREYVMILVISIIEHYYLHVSSKKSNQIQMYNAAIPIQFQDW